MLSPELLNELKEILKDDYGIELNSDDLKLYADVLVAYAEVLASVEFQQIKTNKQYGTQ